MPGTIVHINIYESFPLQKKTFQLLQHGDHGIYDDY